MNQIPLISNNQLSTKIEEIVNDIKYDILTTEEEIVGELQPILEQLEISEKFQIIQYIKLEFQQYDFIQHKIFNFENQQTNEQKVEDYIQIYKMAIKQQEYQIILSKIQFKDFCLQNQIPIQLQKNILLLQKLGKNVRLIFELIEMLNGTQNYCYLKMINIFIELYYLGRDNLQLDQLHSFVGSLLEMQILQFEYYIESFEQYNLQELEEMLKTVQIVQLKNSTSQVEFLKLQQIMKNKSLLLLFKILTLNFFTYQNELEDYLNQFIKKTSYYKVDQFYTIWQLQNYNDEFDYLYFQLVFHYWIKYSQKYNIEQDFKTIGEKIQITQRKIFVLEKFIKEQKQKIVDNIYIYLLQKIFLFLKINDNQLQQKYNEFKQEQILNEKNYSLQVQQQINVILKLKQQDFANLWFKIQKLMYFQLNPNGDIQFLQLEFAKFISSNEYNLNLLKIFNQLLEEKSNNLLRIANILEEEKEIQNYKLNLLTFMFQYIYNQNENSQNQVMNLYQILIKTFQIYQSFKLSTIFNQILNFNEYQKKEQLQILKKLFILKKDGWKNVQQILNAQQLSKFIIQALKFSQNNLLNQVQYQIVIEISQLIDLEDDKLISGFQQFIKFIHKRYFYLIYLLNFLSKNHFNLLVIVKIIIEIYKKVEDKKKLEEILLVFGEIYLDKYKIFQQIKNNLIDKCDEKIIYNQVLIQFYDSTNQLEKRDNLCEQVFTQNSNIYVKLFEQNQYFKNFFLHPEFLQCKQIQSQFPKNLQISLINFNKSLADISYSTLETVVTLWCQDFKNQEKFLNLIPFLFNIIKRGASPKPLLYLINQNVNSKQLISRYYNFKSLFQLLYNNSDEELKIILLKLHSKSNPIPLLYQNPQIQEVQNYGDIYKFNQNIIYLISNHYSIINMSLLVDQKQIGKTDLINKLFYLSEKFSICDTSDLNISTIDCMFDNEFDNTRNFFIADAHGFIPLEILEKILPLFQFWIIQLQSVSQLIESFEKVIKLQSKMVNQPKICLIIRDYNEPEQLIEQYEKQITVAGFYVYKISNLNLQGTDKQQQQREIQNTQKFILNIISDDKNKRPDFLDQDKFLNIIKQDQANLSFINEFEKSLKIISQLKKQLEDLKERPSGFYDQEAFPFRSCNWNLEQLRQKQSKLNKTDNIYKQEIDKKVKEIDSNTQGDNSNLFQQKFDLVNKKSINEKMIIENENEIQKLQQQTLNPTSILELFCELFEQKNYYVIYLQFSDWLRQFNSQIAFKLQNRIQEKNEEYQKIKNKRKNEKESMTSSYDIINKYREQLDNIKKEIQKTNMEIELKNIGIELFWKEIIKIHLSQPNLKLNVDPIKVVASMIKKGESFELIDGDQLNINSDFLIKLSEELRLDEQVRILILSILGPQSSGKSTLLNKIFGCHFWASAGRCTKGINLQLIEIQDKQQFNDKFDHVLLLDSEGLQNPNQLNPEFDKKIALFVLSISDVIIFNVKGEMNGQFRNLIEMCMFTYGQMMRNGSCIKQLSWCFNQNNELKNKNPYLSQIQTIATNLNQSCGHLESDDQNQKIDYAELFDINLDNISILGIAYSSNSWKQNSSNLICQEWTQQIQNDAYTEDAYNFGIKAIHNYKIKYLKQKQDEQTYSNWSQIVKKVENDWITISKLPDLLEFSDLVQHKQNELMKNCFDLIMKNQNLEFQHEIIENIRNEIKKKENRFNFQIFQKIGLEQQKIIAQRLEKILEDSKNELLKYRQTNQIFKKIYLKFLDILDQRIKGHQTNLDMIINYEIDKQKIEFQQKQGFKLFDDFILELSENTELLKQFQKDEKMIKDKFNDIWNTIRQQQRNSQTENFKQFQQQQIENIKKLYPISYYTYYENNYIEKFIQEIIPQNPFEKYEQEKDQIFQIFKKEYNESLITQLNQKEPLHLQYLEKIYNLSMIERIEQGQKNSLIRIKDFYKIQVKYHVLEKDQIEKYFKSTFSQDFQSQFQKQKKKKTQNLANFDYFFQILAFFNIGFIQLQLDILKQRFLQEEDIQIQLENLKSSFNFNNIDFNSSNSQQFQKYLQDFKISLKPFEISKTFENFDNFQSFKMTQQIVTQKELNFLPKNQNCDFLVRVMRSSFSGSVHAMQENFQKLMEENQVWKMLFYEIYDIVKVEILGEAKYESNCQLQQDYDLTLYDQNFISDIIKQLENRIKENYNKQFAHFGMIFYSYCERTIYYQALFLIWRFICFKKQNMYDDEYNKISEQEEQQYKKFKDNIDQNKIEQSRNQAVDVIQKISTEWLNQFYQKNKQEAEQAIKSKQISCQDLIKKLDDQLLEEKDKINYFEEGLNEQILSYIRNQKEYITRYAKSYVSQLKEELIKKYQKILNSFLQKSWESLERNASQLLENINQCNKNIDQNQTILVSFYFKNQNSQLDEQEKILYQNVLNYLQGRDGESLDQLEYSNIFNFTEELQKIQLPELDNINDKKVCILASFVDEILKQIKKEQTKCNSQNLQFSKFQIDVHMHNLEKNMIGCLYSCPICSRKCDQSVQFDNPSQKHQHSCFNGHQLRGMSGVWIGDKPSLLTCQQIKDTSHIIIQENKALKQWKEIKKIHGQWCFNNNNDQQDKQNNEKMQKAWNNGIGELICKQLSQEFKKEIVFFKKNDNYDKDYKVNKQHYIFMLDDSSSMKGQKWENISNCFSNCLKIINEDIDYQLSLIQFSFNADIVINCEIPNYNKHREKVNFKRSLWRIWTYKTNFDSALDLAYDLILNNHENFLNTNMLLFTDGDGSYPQTQVDKFCQLPPSIRQKISFIACTDSSDSKTLDQIVKTFKAFEIRSKKQKVESDSLFQVWSEIISESKLKAEDYN